MKALSIRQPWASLIVLGYKPVENRTRTSYHRGPLLIHASKTFDLEGFEWIKAHRAELALPENWTELPAMQGGIIGRVDMWDVSTRTESLYSYPASVTEQDRRWFFGPHGYWMRDPRQLPFLPWRGQLGMFEVPVTEHYASGAMPLDGDPWELQL